jgi:hypothetical protein
MDASCFDTLLRAFSRKPSRRDALRVLSGIGLAGLLGRADAEAKRKKRKKRKNRCNPQCTGKTCGDDGCGGTCGDCSDGLTCDGTTCVCPTERVCGALCCPVGELCVGGSCKGPGTCQASDNLCTTVATCNGNGVCGCLHRLSDNAVFCATGNPDACLANCQTDADCAGFGAGSFCVKKVGEICCGPAIPINQGFCALPCPT